ncbi:MAG: acyl-CoA dehydrogenase family protein, partial [Alphaproteobacteria bacterium]|nr:acyl-CoA dehydrogenase family protein [Alphaproteobacteria bacterium]
MNFDFSDDQKLLKEQVRKFLADKCPTKVVRRVLDGDETHAEEVWKGLVELGVPGTAIPEAYGGLGLSPLELCVVAEEIGRAAAPVPFDSSVVLASEALKLAGSEAQKKQWLPLLAAGEAIGTLAVAEGPEPPRPRNIGTTFGGGRLNGKKVPVIDGEAARLA